jgi:hypothetical protein
MPRAVSTAGLQNAFANLGQANARQAALELQERERRRAEIGQLGGIAGGLVGGAFGGPIGASLGSVAGSKLAGGDVAQASLGSQLGGAVAKRQQQLGGRRALTAARQAATQPPTQEQPTIEPSIGALAVQQALAPTQDDTTGQVPVQSIEQVQPPLLPVQEQVQPPLLPADEILPSLDSFSRGISTSSFSPIEGGVPTQAQPQVDIQPAEPARPLSPLEQFTGQMEQQLAVEQAVLNDPRLAEFPQAFDAQQNRVQAFQQQLQDAKFQLAKIQEQSFRRPVPKKGERLFTLREGDNIIRSGITSDEARQLIQSFPRKQGLLLEEVGRPLQKTRRGVGDASVFGGTINEINRAESPQEIQDIIEATDFGELSSLESTRLSRLAEQKRNRLQGKKSGEIEKKIKDSTLDESYNELDQSLLSGDIDFKQKEKLEKQLIKREERDLKLKGRKAYKEKEQKSINFKIQLADILNTLDDNVDEFGSVLGEQAVSATTSALQEKILGKTSGRTKVKKALARLTQIVSSEEIKGVPSNFDVELLQKGMPKLGDPEALANDYITKIKSRLSDSWVLEKDTFKNLGRELDIKSISRLDNKLGFKGEDIDKTSIRDFGKDVSEVGRYRLPNGDTLIIKDKKLIPIIKKRLGLE